MAAVATGRSLHCNAYRWTAATDPNNFHRSLGTCTYTYLLNYFYPYGVIIIQLGPFDRFIRRYTRTLIKKIVNKSEKRMEKKIRDFQFLIAASYRGNVLV